MTTNVNRKITMMEVRNCWTFISKVDNQYMAEITHKNRIDAKSLASIYFCFKHQKVLQKDEFQGKINVSHIYLEIV